MKILSSVVKNSVYESPKNAINIFEGIAHAGLFIKKPICQSDFNCPRCLGTESFKYPEGNKVFLACHNPACCTENTKILAEIKNRNPILQTTNFSGSGLEGEYLESSLEKCNFPEETKEREKEIIRHVEEISKRPKGFTVLAGDVGIGKTYLSCAGLISYLNWGRNGLFIRYSDINQRWLDIKSQGNSELHFLHMLQEKEFLVIDDLGIRKPTEAFGDFLYLLIDKRKNNSNLATIFTTNLNSNEMELSLGKSITSRIASGKCYRIKGIDRRIAKF